MQNIKYHLTTTASVILFSYTLASAVNQVIRFSFAPDYTLTTKTNRISEEQKVQKTFEDYKVILNTNFFQIGEEGSGSSDDGTEAMAASDLQDLTLLGTISGPASIARALIRKKTEKESQIFKLWNDVYGYKLIRIDNAKTYLKKGEKIEILDMFAKEQTPEAKVSAGIMDRSGEPAKQNQNISRSEMQQNVMNNIDNALNGLRAGPFREDGKITGYKLFRVAPNNIFYKLGARSGDVVKRVNGHPIDSTEKLMGLWQSIQGESKITVDIERGGKLQNYNFNVTD